MYTRTALIATLVIAAAAAGCDERGPDPVQVETGPVVGGPERTALTILDERLVVRTELYLDTLRVGADEFAPFEIEWDASDFDEGPRRLRGVAYFTDGSTIDGEVEVEVDNTAPTIGELAQPAVRGQPLALPAADGGGLASVEVVLGDGRRLVASGPRFQVPWDEPCGPREIEVIATDRAGWVTTRVLSVSGQDPDDADCDGHVATVDCDDTDPAVHPGAPDDGSALVDRNCDGVPGTDGDADGSASVATGGGDCDDGNPAIYPGWYAWDTVPLVVDGATVTWSPGTAAVVMSIMAGRRAIRVAINRAGTIELVTWIENRGIRRETLVTGANPGRIALVPHDSAPVELVYAAGAELRVRELDGADRPEERVLTAATTIGELAVFADGDTHLAVRAGGEVWLATRPHGAQSWTAARLRDDLPASARDLAIAPRPLRVGWVEAGVIHDVDRDGYRRIRSGGAGYLGGLAVDADGAWLFGMRGALHRDEGTSSTPVSPSWLTVERVVNGGDSTWYQARSSDGTRVNVAHGASGASRWLGSGLDLDAVHGNGPYGRPVIAAPGAFAWVRAARVPPTDPVDGVDRDCDGRD